MININDIEITIDMLSIIAEIDNFKGAWNTIDKIAANRLKPLKKITTIESIGSSNRIEGNKLTDREIDKVLSQLNKNSFYTRDEQEVIGYADVMNFVFDNYNDIPITENYIKQMHKILLQHTTKDERHRSDYKKLSNSVMAFDENNKEVGIVFETATPFETPFKMEELVSWTRNSLKEKIIHPIIVIGIFIVEFLAIHPFQDGNGRISRILTNLLLLKSGYTYMPYSSLESIIELNKGEYYRTLRETQKTLKTANVNYKPWLIFFLKTLLQQKRNLQNKLPKENEIVLPETANNILQLFEIQNNITINDVVKKLGININTAKKSVKMLADKGYIIKHGTTKGAWYNKNENYSNITTNLN